MYIPVLQAKILINGKSGPLAPADATGPTMHPTYVPVEGMVVYTSVGLEPGN